MVRQLERQASHNLSLTARVAALDANLSLPAGFTLLTGEMLEKALDDSLHHYLNASGLSKEAIFLYDTDGTLHLRAYLGYADDTVDRLRLFFDRIDLLEQAIRDETMMAFRRDQEAHQDAATILAQAGDAARLVIPLVLGNERLGALVVGSSEPDLAERWGTFARGLGGQISQTIGLMRAQAQWRRRARRAPATNRAHARAGAIASVRRTPEPDRRNDPQRAAHARHRRAHHLCQ